MPNTTFDPEWYMRTYPDAAASGVSPEHHFQKFGRAEGRGINAELPDGNSLNAAIEASRRPAAETRTRTNGFNDGTYLNNNPDVKAAGVDPFEHYLRSGRNEGRSPDGQTLGRSDYIPPRLNPLDPSSWDSFTNRAHNQTAGINRMAGVLDDTSQFLGTTPDQARAMMYPKGPEAAAMVQRLAPKPAQDPVNYPGMSPEQIAEEQAKTAAQQQAGMNLGMGGPGDNSLYALTGRRSLL